MRRSTVFVVLTVALVAMLAFAGIASAAPKAPKMSVLDQCKALIAEAVAGLQTQVDALAARVGFVEEDVTALDARVDAVEAGSGQPGQPWLVEDIEVDLRFSGRYYRMDMDGDGVREQSWYEIGYSIWTYLVDAQGSRIFAEPSEYQDAVFTRMKYAGYDSGWQGGYGSVPNTNPGGQPLPEGTPIEVEYWVEENGIRKHATMTFDEWTYVEMN